MNLNVVMVKNVSDSAYEWMFDGVPYRLEAGETKGFIEDVARHGLHKSIQRWNPVDHTYERKLIVPSEESEPDEPITTAGPEEELIDRSSMEDGDVERIDFNNSDAPGKKPGRRR